jgi:AraC-like DNA-binding protein
MLNVNPLPKVGMVYRSFGQRSPWERLGCGVMDKRQNLADHAHYTPLTYSLIWIVAGSGLYLDESGRSYPFRAGDCFHRIPGRTHSTQPDAHGGWLEWFVDCGPLLYDAFAGMHLLQPEPPVWKATSCPSEDLEQLRRGLESAAEYELPVLSSELWRLIPSARQDVSRDFGADDIDQACEYLASHCHQRINLRRWCCEQGLQYERFRKAFTKRLGEPPGQYRVRRRMERACALLISNDRPIADVAERLGYASPYEFSAQFRQRFGMSPKRYRLINGS